MLKQMLEYSTLMMVPKDRLYVVANVVTNSTRLRQNKLGMTLFDTVSKVQILVKTVLFLFFRDRNERPAIYFIYSQTCSN